jgi:hypothetical protein
VIALLALAALDSTAKTLAALTIVEPLVITAANSPDWTASTSQGEVAKAANTLLQCLFQEPHVKADQIGEVALAAELRIAVTLDGKYSMQLVADLPPRRTILPLSLESWAPRRDSAGGAQLGFEPIGAPTSVPFLPQRSWIASIQARWQPLLKAVKSVDQQLPEVYHDYLKGIKPGGYIKREDLDPRVRVIFEANERGSVAATPYRTEAALWRKIESTRIGPARLILNLVVPVATPAGRTEIWIPLYNGKRLLPGYGPPPED